MAIQGQDYETIHQMVGTTEFPSELVEEYDVRIRMLVIAGGGYSLGPIGCVDLCRFVGLQSKTAKKELHYIDWPLVKIDTDIVVTEHGVDRLGKYRGSVQAGRIIVKFADLDWLSEAVATNVRLAVTDDFLPKIELEDLPVTAMDMNTDKDCDPSLKTKWSMIEPGTIVETLAGDDVIEYEYLGLAKEKGCLAVMDKQTRHRYVLDAADVFLKQAEPIEA